MWENPSSIFFVASVAFVLISNAVQALNVYLILLLRQKHLMRCVVPKIRLIQVLCCIPVPVNKQKLAWQVPVPELYWFRTGTNVVKKTKFSLTAGRAFLTDEVKVDQNLNPKSRQSIPTISSYSGRVMRFLADPVTAVRIRNTAQILNLLVFCSDTYGKRCDVSGWEQRGAQGYKVIVCIIQIGTSIFSAIWQIPVPSIVL